jgi:hypothetical protein
MDHPVLVGSQTVHEVEATTPLKGVAHIFLHHITVFQQADSICDGRGGRREVLLQYDVPDGLARLRIERIHTA